jgi:formylglycine-generating enzyme required for sulfatase activity
MPTGSGPTIMTATGPQTDQPASVFISYSRNDLLRAEQLRDRLRAHGVEAYLDKHDILPGEPWQERLAYLIEAADVVTFLVSPDSVSSPICDWEVNETERLGKRLLPVIIRATPIELIPGRLRRLNFIFMRDPTEEAEGLASLRMAIDTDFTWVREHTRLGQLAADWDRNRRSSEFLLRGSSLSAAELWISERPGGGAAPSQLHREFIQASRAEALRDAVRAGRTQVLIAILVIAVTASVGYLAWANRSALEFQARLILDRVVPAALSATAERALKVGETLQECASCPAMTVIPTGSFLMGSPDGEGHETEQPRHEVAISRRIAVSKFLITFAQWDACMAHGGCAHRADDRGWGRGLIPVTDISWSDAKTYVAWLSKQTGKPYRLLSEAEWEYAARAGSNDLYPWGNELGVGRANCPGWQSQWEDKQPSPVGTFPPNAFGLYDMIGNLWEWVEDSWHPNYAGAAQDGSVWRGGDDGQRVTRGGSWGVTQGECNLAYRDFARPPDFRNYIFGIRVARTLVP